ncbi:NlpC/P60 family protein [Falsochrobactrum ovis]|uniref:SH3 domain-containing protein n=1 Tax=Falsochrobactrum ovis TaxID=1293442 RepID=A0A364JYW4_9HYPH|nr:NlpC/P60 family protein [Falsochrobactrum ovis]RAK33925.1 SH3 domain-containing protein [Falsochrobactrum ovis]
MKLLDQRLNAYRPDLADQRLEGQIEADRFVRGISMRVSAPVLDIRADPRPDSGLQTQAIYGDDLKVFDEQDGWSWVQAERDGYVGYVSSAMLEKPRNDATHMVIVPRTFVYPGADLRFPHSMALSLGSRVSIVGQTEKRGTQYALLESGEALIARHLRPIGDYENDFVRVAESLLHTPYLWGGTSGFGIDCSGLVQLAMWVTGKKVLRDSDMQQAGLGEIIEPNADFSNLQRGDLVFWKGHVAICTSPEMLIHASGHTMTVTVEPLKEAIKRIDYLYGLPTFIRRP